MRTTKQRMMAVVALFVMVLTTQTVFAFYNPSTGRFLSRDPIGERGGINLYEFVENNPVGLIDSFGNQSLKIVSPNGVQLWVGPADQTPSGYIPLYTDGYYRGISDGLWHPIPQGGTIHDQSGDILNMFLAADGARAMGDAAAGLGSYCIRRLSRGLGNPFEGMAPSEIDAIFRKRGFVPRGPDPLNGDGGYVNPETGRSYHIDYENSYGEEPHVDVNRPRNYNGPLDKKKYMF